MRVYFNYNACVQLEIFLVLSCTFGAETTEKIYKVIQLLPVDDIVCQLYIFSASFYGPLESYILSFSV